MRGRRRSRLGGRLLPGSDGERQDRGRHERDGRPAGGGPLFPGSLLSGRSLAGSPWQRQSDLTVSSRERHTDEQRPDPAPGRTRRHAMTPRFSRRESRWSTFHNHPPRNARDELRRADPADLPCGGETSCQKHVTPSDSAHRKTRTVVCSWGGFLENLFYREFTYHFPDRSDIHSRACRKKYRLKPIRDALKISRASSGSGTAGAEDEEAAASPTSTKFNISDSVFSVHLLAFVICHSAPFVTAMHRSLERVHGLSGFRTKVRSRFRCAG